MECERLTVYIFSQLGNKANGKWTFYAAFTELNIEVGAETIDGIVGAITSQSTLKCYIYTGAGNANIYPENAGTLSIDKISDNRTVVKFFSVDGAKEWSGRYYQAESPAWKGWQLSTHEYQEFSFVLSSNVVKKSMCTYSKDDIGCTTYNLGVEGISGGNITGGMLIAILPLGFYPQEEVSHPVVLEGESSTSAGRFTINPANGQVRIYHSGTSMKFAFGGGTYYAKQ